MGPSVYSISPIVNLPFIRDLIPFKKELQRGIISIIFDHLGNSLLPQFLLLYAFQLDSSSFALLTDLSFGQEELFILFFENQLVDFFGLVVQF